MIISVRRNLVFALLIASTVPAVAANRFFVPDVLVPEGSAANRVEVLCEHDEALLAFSIRLRFDPSEIRVTALTTDGTDAESFEFSSGFHDDVAGEIVFGAVVDQTAPLDRVLAAGGPHSLLGIVFDVAAPEGTRSAVEFVASGGVIPPGRIVHENALVVRSDVGLDERRVVDLLEGGQVTVSAPGPLADAGDDQLRPELERIALDASASISHAGLPMSFDWKQISGPPAQDVSGESEPRIELTLPPVVGDTTLTFAVEVSDAIGLSRDEVTVTAVDMDLRRAELSNASEEPRWLDAGQRATVFAAALTWISAVEDGRWQSIRFTPSGDPAAHERVQAATLYLDTDGDDDVGPNDEVLDHIDEITAPDEPLEFAFARVLRDGGRNGFVLVVDLAPENDGTDGEADDDTVAQALLPPFVLMLALAACAAWVAIRIRHTLLRYELAALIAVGALLGVLPVACSSGGGGGSGPPPTATTVAAPPASTIRFDVRDSSDVDVSGIDTGVRVPVEGAPAQGALLEI